jgi:ribonuclease P protein component
VRVMRGEQYLTRPAQYSLVYSRGSSWANHLLVLKAMPNGRDLSRYGFSVSRRVGGAVVRNRVKRRLREILRLTSLRPGWDILIIVRPPAAEGRYVDLERAAKELLSRARILVESYEEVSLRTH